MSDLSSELRLDETNDEVLQSTRGFKTPEFVSEDEGVEERVEQSEELKRSSEYESEDRGTLSKRPERTNQERP